MLRVWPSWLCPINFAGTCEHTAGSTGSLYCWLNSHNCNFNIKFSSQEQAPWHGGMWDCSCLILDFQVSGVSSVGPEVPKWRLCCLCPKGEGSDRFGLLSLKGDRSESEVGGSSGTPGEGASSSPAWVEFGSSYSLYTLPPTSLHLPSLRNWMAGRCLVTLVFPAFAVLLTLILMPWVARSWRRASHASNKGCLSWSCCLRASPVAPGVASAYWRTFSLKRTSSSTTQCRAAVPLSPETH